MHVRLGIEHWHTSPVKIIFSLPHFKKNFTSSALWSDTSFMMASRASDSEDAAIHDREEVLEEAELRCGFSSTAMADFCSLGWKRHASY